MRQETVKSCHFLMKYKNSQQYVAFIPIHRDGISTICITVDSIISLLLSYLGEGVRVKSAKSAGDDQGAAGERATNVW